jgi:hypothetical protein
VEGAQCPTTSTHKTLVTKLGGLLEEADERVFTLAVGEVEFDAGLGLRHGFKVERVTQRQNWFWLSQSSPSFPSLGQPRRQNTVCNANRPSVNPPAETMNMTVGGWHCCSGHEEERCNSGKLRGVMVARLTPHSQVVKLEKRRKGALLC